MCKCVPLEEGRSNSVFNLLLDQFHQLHVCTSSFVFVSVLEILERIWVLEKLDT